jgi:hypothetical protein
MKPPYCEINGLVCTEQVSSVELDGADMDTSTQALAGRKYGEITDKGRNPRKITIKTRFLTEEDLDEFIAHINSLPDDCEAYPFRDDRCCYVKKAYAVVASPEPATINGEYTTFFRGKAVLHTREPWMYGIEKGLRYESPQALPVTSSLAHEGTVEGLTAFDKICARGEYIYGSGYVENLALTFEPTDGSARVLQLCTKMMRNDLFEVDRFGNVEHSYANDFDCDISALQADLHGATYLAYCTIADEKLTISGEGRCIFPFYGPLPISAEKPYLNFMVTSLGAYAPRFVAGRESDLSDLAEIDANIHVGENVVRIPNYESEGNLFLGFVERRCWIAAASMATARGYTAGGGTASNALCMGGWSNATACSPVTEEFNGTTWSSGGDLAIGRRMLAGDGGVSDGICMGGLGSGEVHLASTEEYNGTAWSAGGNLATGRNGHAGGGSSSNTICMGGKYSAGSPYYTTTSELYNGTAWSAGGAIGDAKTGLGGGGNAASAMCCGGSDTDLTYGKHEVYDGSTWQQAGNLLQARHLLAADGDYVDGMAIGGDTNVPVGTTEEYDGTSWSYGGSNLITARYGLAGGGIATNAICMGGQIPAGGLNATVLANAETYGRNSSMTIESIEAVVRRHIDPAAIPTVDPGDTFKLKIDGGGAEKIAYLEMYFRGAWWF